MNETVVYKKLKPSDIVKCLRCGKAEFAGNADKWNIVFDEGVVVGFICEECQTDEEFMEAEVNEAIIDYSQARTIHTFEELFALFRPKWAEARTLIEGGEVERGNALLADNLEKFRKAFNAMNRYNYDAQIEDIQEAFGVLRHLGEL